MQLFANVCSLTTMSDRGYAEIPASDKPDDPAACVVFILHQNLFNVLKPFRCEYESMENEG